MEHSKEELLLELARQQEIFESEKAKWIEEKRVLTEHNQALEALVLFLKRKPYVASNESLSHEQISLFNEAEVEVETSEKDVAESSDKEQSINKNKKVTTGRRALPAWIDREDVIIDLPAKDKVCANDGSKLKKIGEEVSEKLQIIPLQIKVIRTIRPKYACSCCESGSKIAEVPKSIVPQSIATAETLAFVAVSKYEDALPLYRIENVLERNDIPVSRATLASWMIKCAQSSRPLVNIMRDDLLSTNYIHMDETSVQVLDEENRKATSKSYMWVQLSTNNQKKMVLFTYEPSRSGKTAKDLLENFCGYLQVDGYGGYNFTQSEGSKITRISCLAHVRRKFKILFDDKKLRSSFIIEIINLIRKIYDEQSNMGYDPDTEKPKVIDYKKKYILPQLEKLHGLVATKYGQVPPQTPLGEALEYAHHELPLLIKNYAQVSEIKLDNNPVENAIRPFAVGRKNWLFSQSVDGAEASSILYSLVESAKLNGLDSYQYLKFIFENIPNCKTVEDFEKLLPYNIDRTLLTRLN